MSRASERSVAALAVTCFLSMTSGTGCAPDLRDEYPFDGDTAHGERVTNEDLGGGVMKTTVDSSDKAAWVYLDLDAQKELPVSEALETQAWDLQLQRFKLYSNSGAHGSGGVGVAVLPDANFDSLSAPPDDSAFQSDVDDPASDNDSPFLSGDGWYAYDLLQHKLMARPTVYVVRTTAGAYFKLQFLGYYSSSGDAGHVSFKWARIAG